MKEFIQRSQPDGQGSAKEGKARAFQTRAISALVTARMGKWLRESYQLKPTEGIHESTKGSSARIPATTVKGFLSAALHFSWHTSGSHSLSESRWKYEDSTLECYSSNLSGSQIEYCKQGNQDVICIPDVWCRREIVFWAKVRYRTINSDDVTRFI